MTPTEPTAFHSICPTCTRLLLVPLPEYPDQAPRWPLHDFQLDIGVRMLCWRADTVWVAP